MGETDPRPADGVAVKAQRDDERRDDPRDGKRRRGEHVREAQSEDRDEDREHRDDRDAGDPIPAERVGDAGDVSERGELLDELHPDERSERAGTDGEGRQAGIEATSGTGERDHRIPVLAPRDPARDDAQERVGEERGRGERDGGDRPVAVRAVGIGVFADAERAEGRDRAVRQRRRRERGEQADERSHDGAGPRDRHRNENVRSAGEETLNGVNRAFVIDEASVTALLRRTFPDADVAVWDLTGTMDHLQVLVRTKAFAGVSPLDRHRMVERALAPARADGRIHALQIRTALPED